MLKLTRLAAVALIALALVLALAAFALSRRTPPPLTAPTAASAPATRAPVVEAAVLLPAGRPIRAADLRMGTTDAASPGAYDTIAEATGAVPVRDVAAGSALDSGLMAQGYALRLNPGERALAVPVDELVAAGNRILPGDYVDVFLNLRAPGGMNTDGQAQARLLLSRLRVLSYGTADSAPGQAATAPPTQDAAPDSRAADIQGSRAANGSSADGTQAPARSAVLAVPVAEANRLLLGAQQGKLFLALRNPTDVGLPDPGLFAPAVAVLAPRRELDPEQRLALASPENDAFAGLDADALAGRRGARAPAPTASAAPAPVRRTAPRLDRGIEIIRGDLPSHSGSR